MVVTVILRPELRKAVRSTGRYMFSTKTISDSNGSHHIWVCVLILERTTVKFAVIEMEALEVYAAY